MDKLLQLKVKDLDAQNFYSNPPSSEKNLKEFMNLHITQS